VGGGRRGIAAATPVIEAAAGRAVREVEHGAGIQVGPEGRPAKRAVARRLAAAQRGQVGHQARRHQRGRLDA
jgi:hypothetical protein